MLPRRIDEIDVQYLRSLPDHGPSESKRIEYKSQFRDSGDRVGGIDRDTFRKDVSQFANTEGGDLIIGVGERDGLPFEVPGVDLGSDTAHATKERLDQILLEIQPRLTGHQIVFHEVQPGRFVFVVRVPQSFRAPHSIGTGKGFFYRTNSGRDAMNVDQVRSSFLGSAGIETQLQHFRSNQVQAISDVPRFRLEAGLVAVLHVLPVVGVSRSVVVDVVGNRNQLLEGGLAGRRMHTSGVNFDGCYCRMGFDSQPCGGYVQWYRNAYRESVWVHPPQRRVAGDREDAPILDEVTLAQEIAGDLKRVLQNLSRVDVPPPYFVAVTLLHCRGYQLGFYDRRYGMALPHRGTSVCTHAELSPLEFLIESEGDDLTAALRPSSDQLANAFGLERSANFDANGSWVHG